MMEENVSIIIPFYNCEYIDQAIESALHQTYRNVEVIVVNDGSTKYTEKIAPFKEYITLIEKNNGGTASALNAGIRQASGEYIAWLSSDDLFYPNKTADQLRFMKNRKACISYGGFVLIDETGNGISRPGLLVPFPDRRSFLKAMKRKCPVNGCTVMVKKDVFQTCGLFDETFIYAHDYDMWLRIVQRYDFHLYRKPIVKYRVHGKMGTIMHKKDLLLEIKQIRNKYRSVLDQLIAEEAEKK